MWNLQTIPKSMALGPLNSLSEDKKMWSFLHRPNQKDLVMMAEMLESGKVKPVINRNYVLSEVPLMHSSI
ncbi:hypothetical protein [Bacillus sp. JJ1562]|uniref:hypothetical protein n=1 Tax=Bacillus sp. JJ1562 TaxID=3122960 RepID=UPI0030012D5C